jgi:hypothetical protein
VLIRRSLSWGVTAAILLSGCSLPKFVRSGTKAPSPKPTVSGSPFTYGSGLDALPEATEGADPAEKGGGPAPSTGTLVLTLVDHNKLNPSGIPVKMSGVIQGLYRSDSQGKLSFQASPGQFSAQVMAGCTGPLIVEYGGGGGGYLVAGQKVNATINVAWKHLVAPADAAYPSKGPNWPIGETIGITFDLYDRCNDDKARNAEFPTWSFRPSPNVEVVGKPSLRSNSNGQSELSVRCKSGGDVALVAFDTKNPTDEVDMVRAMLFEGKFRCGTG